MSGTIPREVYIGGIILFFIAFTFIYSGIGNTLIETQGDNYLPNTIDSELKNPLITKNPMIPDSLLGMFKYVKTGFQAYSDMDLGYINILFIFITMLLLLFIGMLILHG